MLPKIPGYEVEAELGRGGMGVVYKARHLDLNRTVALKMILAGTHANTEELLRFLAEAETAAHLQHQGIVQIFDTGRVDGLPYITMECVDGGSLADRLRAGPLSPLEATRVALLLAEAVAHAHAVGVVHRDLKPSNILFTLNGTPKITDFGLAKRLEVRDGMTRTGSVFGTPAYMAPEQARGDTKAVGEPADVYALGAILYEMLTGRPPFRSANPLNTLTLVQSAAPERPRAVVRSVPSDLETIVLKCLEKEPGKRYASAVALAEDLRRFQDGRAILARPVGVVEKLWRWTKRRPAIAALLALVFASLTAGTVISTAFAIQAAENAYRADANARELEKKVAEVEAAREALNVARLDALRKLELSYLAQARAQRHSGEPGLRYKSLAALKEAATLANQLGMPLDHWLELRNEAVAICSLPVDIRTLRRWPNPYPKGADEVCFDPGLEHYATHTGDGVVVVVRVEDGKEVSRLEPPAGVQMVRLKFSPDSNLLAVEYLDTRVPGHRHEEVRVWDWRRREALVRHTRQNHPLGAVYWAQDSQRFYTAHWVNSRDLITYRASDGAKLAQFEVGLGWYSLLLLPGREQALQVSNREAIIRDLSNGHVVVRWPLPEASDRGAIRNDGRMAATVHGNRVALWDLATTNAPLRYLTGHRDPITFVRFSPCNRLVATASWDSTIRFWDCSTGRELLSFAALTQELAFSPDGRRFGARHENGDVAVFELPEGREVRRARAGTSFEITTLDLNWSPDGHVFATAGWDGVRIWSPAGRELTRLTRNRAMSVLFDPAGARLFVLEPDQVTSWSVARKGGRLEFRPLKAATLNRHTDHGIHPRIGMDAGGKLLAVPDYEGGQVLLFPSGDLTAAPKKIPASEVWDTAVSPDGEWVLTAGYQYVSQPNSVSVTVWSAGGREAFRCQGLRCHVGFSPDGRWAVAGDWASYKFFRVGDWAAPPRTIPRRKDSPWVAGEFAFSPDSRLLATTDSRWHVRVLDAATDNPIANLWAGDEQPVRRLAFSPDGTRLAIARDGNLVHIWDFVALRASLDELGLADGFPPFTRSAELEPPEVVVQGR